jgi:hypothetical protein
MAEAARPDSSTAAAMQDRRGIFICFTPLYLAAKTTIAVREARRPLQLIVSGGVILERE